LNRKKLFREELSIKVRDLESKDYELIKAAEKVIERNYKYG
jgi:hypothetical protein